MIQSSITRVVVVYWLSAKCKWGLSDMSDTVGKGGVHICKLAYGDLT